MGQQKTAVFRKKRVTRGSSFLLYALKSDFFYFITGYLGCYDPLDNIMFVLRKTVLCGGGAP